MGRAWGARRGASQLDAARFPTAVHNCHHREARLGSIGEAGVGARWPSSIGRHVGLAAGSLKITSEETVNT